MSWVFPLRAAWAKDLGAALDAWGLVATFAVVGLAAAVFAGWRRRGGILDTTAGIAGGAFWEEEGLVAEGTLPLALRFLLVTVVKGVSVRCALASPSVIFW